MNVPLRIAVMGITHPNWPMLAGYYAKAFEQYCQVDWYKQAGEEPEGYDHYFYVDDSPTSYMEPKYNPASFYAFDMVIPRLWFLQPAEHYLDRLKAFDHNFVTATNIQQFCWENGQETHFLGFAADPEYHKPHDVERTHDWIAVWHNCDDRVEATERALQRFPSGRVLWAGGHLYANHISQGKCVLNMLRGNLVNMRVFEAMAIGTPLITTRHPDMIRYGLVEREHYLGHSSIEEMLDQVEWVNKNQDEALAMAARARKFVLANHTYDHRVREVMRILNDST